MSIHSYSRCWLHLIWATLNREPMLSKEAAAKVSTRLCEDANERAIYLKINYVNSDHVHALVDLPTGHSIEELMQLLKGSLSHWINENNLVAGKFSWGRGYGVFSVSQSHVSKVAEYIANQNEHHRKRSFLEEYQNFVTRCGLSWREDTNR